MKGISAIIAVILLLLITISVVGFAFLFFSRITTTAGQAAENQTSQQVLQFSKKISIDTNNATLVAIRNTGSVTIGASEVSVYVSGAPRTCVPDIGPWSPGQVLICNFVPACTAGQTLRVTAPANSVDVNC